MMKINKSFWILMVVFLGLSSCEDEILDKETRSEFNEEVAWESPEMVQVYLNSLYSEFEMDAGMLYECLGDDYETTKNSKIWTINKDLVNSSNFDAGWSFRELRKANQVITRLSGESKIEMNEAERANLLGQAHFFRAWTLFQKAKVFGGLILLEKVMKPDDDFDLPRATEEDTWTYIIKEFRKSADYLKGQNVENYRVSYGAALAMLMRAQLYAGSYDGVKETYAEIEKVGYDLHETYGPIWKTPSAWKSSPEVILAYEYRKKEKVNPWTRVNCPQSSISDLNGGGGAGVTHQHTEVYLVKDEDGVWRKWEDSKHKANTKPADGVLEHLYGNRELRFYENVMTDKTTCMGYDFAFNEGGKSGSLTNFEEEEIWDHVSQVKTGYMCKKFMGEDPDYLPTRKYECDLPSIALRYAEVILNYAEACLMTGEEANARAAINRTRKRAGLPELDASADLREEYKDERHKELAFEGHRYFDLLRWAKQEKRDMIPELNRRSKWILIDKERKAYKIIEAKYDKYYRKWSKRRFLMPIPFGQLEYNPNLVQNPGW